MSLLTCKQFLDELNEYLDEEVQGNVRHDLEEHLNECPNCWVVCDTTKKTIQIYKGMEPQPVPPEVQSRLVDAVEKKIAAHKRHA
jgi:anti-sigma factor (TIGR02949 family)